MSLSCSCYDDYEWFVETAQDLAPLATKRMRRCYSCKCRIAVGDECLKLRTYEFAGYDTIEAKIWGEGNEVERTTRYLCETCAGLYWALEDLGFCISFPSNMRDLTREYAQMQRDGGVFRGQMQIRKG